MDDEKNLLYIDLLRIFAVIEVIAIHVSGSFVPLMGRIPEYGWWTANFIRSFAASAVPIFILISGSLVIKKEPWNVFFRKRFLKILIPLIAWSAIYVIFRIFFLKEDLKAKEVLTDLFLTGNGVYFHLWFFYMIIPLYVVAPFLNRYFHNSPQKIRRFIIIFFIAGTVHFFLAKHINLNHFILGIWFYSSSLFYFSLGYYLKNEEIKNWKLLISLLIISTLMVASGNYYFKMYETDWIFHFYNPLIIVMSVSVFMLFKEIFVNIKRINFSKSIASLSFGIYLVHPIVLWIIMEKIKLNTQWNADNIMLEIPVVVASTYIVSLLIIFTMKKIPVFKFMVP